MIRGGHHELQIPLESLIATRALMANKHTQRTRQSGVPLAKRQTSDSGAPLTMRGPRMARASGGSGFDQHRVYPADPVVVHPARCARLADLREFTRGWVGQVGKDLGTPLAWVADNHWNTDNPHTHIALRGKEANGRGLVIAWYFMSHVARLSSTRLAL